MTDDFNPNDHSPLFQLGNFAYAPNPSPTQLSFTTQGPQVSTVNSTPHTQESVGKTIEDSERDRLIDIELAKLNHPCNPTNAARAGWDAALKFVKTQNYQFKYKWTGVGPEPESWYAADRTKVYRDYMAYCMD